LCAGDVAVEVLKRPLDIFRAPIAGFRHLVDPAAPHGDEGELGSDEESVEAYQQQDKAKAPGDGAGPELGRGFLRQGEKVHVLKSI